MTSLEQSIAMLAPIAKQANRNEPMVTISFEVPLSELEFKEESVQASDDHHEVWGASCIERTYDVDTGYIYWQGRLVEVDEGGLHHVEDRLITEFEGCPNE